MPPAPFKIAIADTILEDLSARLAATRFPPGILGENWNAGTSPAYHRELLNYWRTGFDWRAVERYLNSYAHFRVDVDGTQLHFIHERGLGPDPLPLILTHGYPDSFARFLKLIPLLVDPGAHGGDTVDAFSVVVPSLTGYGFSEARPDKGGTFGFASLWHKLMVEELGYARFGAHGGDWGSTVTEHLARGYAHSVVAIHLTDVPFWHMFQKPTNLNRAEEAFLKGVEQWQKDRGAYAMIQGTRPVTAAAGLSDSPSGLAAWIVEKFHEWSDCGGDIETRFTKDELLTNVMLYWCTNTIESSFLPYHDFMTAGAVRWIIEAAKNWIGSTSVPAAFALFPADISHPPREWAERFFNVQRWTEMPSGGHFAAMEEPQALAEDIRAFFRPCRS
jgi:pimeloyl-ACP methyl ester carboxylesterase